MSTTTTAPLLPELLRKAFPVGATVHTISRHSTESADYIAVLVTTEDGSIGTATQDVARLLGLKYSDRHRGLRVQGTGLDRHHWLVHLLGLQLHRDGYALRNVRIW